MFNFIDKIKIMKQIMFLIIMQFIIISAISQNILVVEKPGKVNNIKYRVGERIELKTINGERIKGIINQIRDTAVVVNYYMVKNSDIKNIYTLRRLVSAFSFVGIEGGLGYVVIDGFNGLINNESPIIANSTLKTGGIMFGAGILLRSIAKRKRHIDNENWRIRVLNFSILTDPGIHNQPIELNQLKTY